MLSDVKLLINSGISFDFFILEYFINGNTDNVKLCLISLFKNRDYDLDENISQNGISLIAEKYSLRTGLDNEYGDYKRLLGYY